MDASIDKLKGIGIEHASAYKNIFNTEIRIIVLSFLMIGLALLICSIGYCIQNSLLQNLFIYFVEYSTEISCLCLSGLLW